MRKLLVKDNIIVNIVEADPEDTSPDLRDWVPDCNRGMEYNNGSPAWPAGHVEETAAAINQKKIDKLNAEMVAEADTLLTCLLNKGLLDGTEPEIQGLLSKKAEKDALKNEAP